MRKENVLGVIIGIVIVCAIAAAVIWLPGCSCDSHQVGNRITYGKDVQTFNYAYIRLGDKDIKEGYVTQWRDYDESDVVQVMIDGKYYLTHYSCVVLIADPSMGSIGYDSGLVDLN